MNLDSWTKLLGYPFLRYIFHICKKCAGSPSITLGLNFYQTILLQYLIIIISRALQQSKIWIGYDNHKIHIHTSINMHGSMGVARIFFRGGNTFSKNIPKIL